MSTTTTRRKAHTYKKAGAGNNGESAQERAWNLFAELMIERIEAIEQDWKKPWFTEGLSSWPMNMSGRHYNGANSFMLLLHCEKQGYKYPVFCTFDRVMGLNYNRTPQGTVPAVDANGEKLPQVHVLKGEKSFPVFLTCFTVVEKDTKNKIPYEQYKQLSPEEQQKYIVYPKSIVYNVFNIAQTNMQEARPELYEQIVKDCGGSKPKHEGDGFHFAPLDRMIKENLWICPITPKYGDDCFYSISKKAITVPEYEQFIDGESFYNNLLHEMSHSAGAEEYLNRLKPSAFSSPEYIREECVAEMTSALVCQYYGMDKHIKEDSAAYLKSWLKSLKEDASFIKTVLYDVKRCAAFLTQRIDEVAALE